MDLRNIVLVLFIRLIHSFLDLCGVFVPCGFLYRKKLVLNQDGCSHV